MINPKIASMMSLSMKAGKMQTGEVMAEKLLRNNTACLLILAGDASDNTKKKFINKCFYYKKPALIYATKAELSASIGRVGRAVFIVTDDGLAKKLRELIEPMVSVNNMEVAECQKPEFMN